ncbi:MAG: hypothetical protein K0R29_2371 [Pseudobdellovibrio sp.]|nr:hypothetical protein [Pseudobdellovibrio sp.]
MQLNPSDKTSAWINLRYFRMAIGFFVLLRSITLFFEVSSQLGPAAWIPVDYFKAAPGFDISHFTLYSLCSNEFCTYVLVIVTLASAVMMFFERTAKAGTFLALVLMLSFLKRSNILAAALDRMAVQFLYLLCWAYLLAWLAPALNFRRETSDAIIKKLIQLQICFIYLGAAWGKVNSDSWLSGDAFRILTQYTALVPGYILRYNSLLQTLSPLLCYLGMGFLLTFPVLVHIKKTRLVVLFLGVIFHGCIFIIFGNLKLVSVLLVSTYTIFLSTNEIAWLKSRILKPFNKIEVSR